MTKYTIYRIKPNKRRLWIEWCHELMTVHYQEAQETLVEENLTRESAQTFDIDGGQYVVFTHVSPGEKKPATDRKLNDLHFQMMRECLEKIGDSSFGYDVYV